MIRKPKRLLLKLSGEILMGDKPFGIDAEECCKIASALKNFISSGYEIGVVIGGGNLFRGSNLKQLGMERTPADQMGMLATLINGIALKQALEGVECPAKVLSALECPKVAESYSWRTALQYLSEKNVVIFVGGTGNPYFTTDTAAAMRANEIQADMILKATKVDGVYNKDPLKYSDAIKYPVMSYSQVLLEKLEIMDATAISLCRESSIPILVFNMKLLKQMGPDDILSGKNGTLIQVM